MKGKGASTINIPISHTISPATFEIFPHVKALQIFVRWNNGVNDAMREMTGGSVSRGKNIPEKRNMGVITRV
jgi:hypothetical protein